MPPSATESFADAGSAAFADSFEQLGRESFPAPAVRDSLGMGGRDAVDWRFVDERDVPPGPWKPTITRSQIT